MNGVRIKRGEVWWADLSPVVGSEMGGTRPVLILSNDTGNEHSTTVIVAAISSVSDKHKKEFVCHVPVNKPLPKPSVVELEQLRTIDKVRISGKIGKLDRLYMKKVEKKLKLSLGLQEVRSHG